MSKAYEVDPNNERLLDAKEQGDAIYTEYTNKMNQAIDNNTAAKEQALDQIGEMDKNGNWTKGSAYGAMIDAQNEQTEFAIDQINQQKEEAHKDYLKEQSASYADYQKQTAKHGVNAEKMASQGLQNSGYSESSMVSMYNQYQARVTAAREAYVKIAADFDNQMTAARLQNNAQIAQIALEAMQKRLEVLMQFTMYGNELLTTMASQQATIKQQNASNYLSVYNQLMQENQYKSSVDQHNETMAFQREQFNWQKEQAEAKSSGSGSIKSSSKSKGAKAAGKDSSSIRGKGKTTSTKTSTKDAEAYINELINSGASKDKVATELSLAVKYGALTQAQAQRLRNIYTPRGIQY